MSDNKEQQFSIQPHPAKDNDPSSLVENTPGLMGERANPVASQPGPQILSEQTTNNLEEPVGRDELRKRAEELNKQ